MKKNKPKFPQRVSAQRAVENNDFDALVNQLHANPEFRSIPEEKIRTLIQAIQVTQSYSGPLPPPEHFKGYEDALPGSADRILSMAEKNQQSRFGYNDDIIAADIKRSRNGQWMGFVLSILFIGAAILGMYWNAPIPSAVLGVGGFSQIISLFVVGRRNKG